MKSISVRIENLIENYGLKPSGFASRVGVSPSILSHILHGRNKPSLDLILKIHQAFPEVNLEWLLTGNSDNLEKAQQSKSIKKESKILSSNQTRIVVLHCDGTFEEYEKKASIT